MNKIRLGFLICLFFLTACDSFRGGVREGFFKRTDFPTRFDCVLDALNLFPEIQNPVRNEPRKNEESFIYELDGMFYWIRIFPKREREEMEFWHGNSRIEYRLPRLQSFDKNAQLLEKIELEVAAGCNFDLDQSIIKTHRFKYQSEQ